MKSRVSLNEKMHFTAELGDVQFSIDAKPEFGGEGKGPGPKGLLLTALAGCTAMDVISILRKMRAEPETFSVETEGELTDEHPKVYHTIVITYYFKGGAVNEDKAKRAIDLSLQNYCGVSAMLEKAAKIEYKIVIE